MVTTKVLTHEGSRRAIGAQLGILIAGLLAVGLAPPAQGQMLLIPLSPHAAERLPALALHDGTRLIARGRLPGSLVVQGDRDVLGWPMLMNGVVPLASARPGCGPITA